MCFIGTIIFPKNYYTKNVHFFLGEVFFRDKNMNSSFAVISKLIKSNIGVKCLVIFLMNVSTQALRNYLKCTNIYKGNSSRKKTDLIEMIIYGCIT